MILKRTRTQTSSLFLTELILAILFFSLSSACCVQFFVKAHLMNQDAQARNQAVITCTGATEILAASESVEEASKLILAQYPDTVKDTSNGHVILQIPCNGENDPCSLTIEVYMNDRLLHGDLTVTRDGTQEIIYESQMVHYVQRRRSDEL
jgi:hypothetical protein